MVAYQKGDDSQLGKIYSRLKSPLYSFIYRYSQDEQLSIDIVQDTFMQLQRYKHHFDPDKGSLKAYIFQIAYRLMVTRLNRRRALKKLLPFLVPKQTLNNDHTEQIAIREAIAHLPHIQRAVILLYYYHDMSQKEIANTLQIPKGTVKSRLHTAIQTLKVALEVDHRA